MGKGVGQMLTKDDAGGGGGGGGGCLKNPNILLILLQQILILYWSGCGPINLPDIECSLLFNPGKVPLSLLKGWGNSSSSSSRFGKRGRNGLIFQGRELQKWTFSLVTLRGKAFEAEKAKLWFWFRAKVKARQLPPIGWFIYGIQIYLFRPIVTK